MQDRILARAADLVKPGGRLIYVTCSLFEAENGSRAAGFLKARRDFASVPLDTDLLRRAPDWHEGAHGVMLTPRRTGTDGFFIASFQREAGNST